MSFQNSKEKLEIERIVSAIHQIDYAYVAEQDILNSYTFSEKFYQRMNHMVSRHEKREMWIRLGKISAAVVVLVFLSWNIYHPQYVEAICQKFFQWYEDHVEYRKDSINSGESGVIPQLVLTYLPEGIEVISEHYSEYIGGTIMCTQNVNCLYMPNNSLLDMNNEDVEFYIKSLGNEMIYCFEAISEGVFSHIVWYSDDEKIVYSISGEMKVEDLLKIKDGIKIKK